jgi:hypothetical protein
MAGITIEKRQEQERTVLGLIIANQGIVWSKLWPEARKRGVRSTSTLFEILDRLGRAKRIMRDEKTGGYREYPRVPSKADPMHLQRGNRYMTTPWDHITDDWQVIPGRIYLAFYHYVCGLWELMDVDEKEAARFMFEKNLSLWVGPLLTEATAVAWKNRRKVKKALREIVENGFPEEKFGIRLSLSGPSVDGQG